MRIASKYLVLFTLVLCHFSENVAAQNHEPSYRVATSGTRYLEFAGGASSFRILLEESNLGGKELEMAEHAFAPGTDIRGHAHGSTEIFYVRHRSSRRRGDPSRAV